MMMFARDRMRGYMSDHSSICTRLVARGHILLKKGLDDNVCLGDCTIPSTAGILCCDLRSIGDSVMPV